MRINVQWLTPRELWEDSTKVLIYDCDWGSLPEMPGVYVFARAFGESTTPLYVGQATNLRGRVRKQLNNLRLMRGLENTRIGPRLLLPAEITVRIGHHLARALNLVEQSLIKHYLSEGHELLNIKGTRIVADEITFGGNTRGRQTCPRRISMPK